MEDSTAKHNFALKTVCRICGKRCVKQPKAKYEHGEDKQKNAAKILAKYKVDINNDVKDIHPEYVCLCCVSDCGLTNRPSARPVMQWTKHGPNCLACKLVEETRRGGRPPKPAKVGAKRKKDREEKEERQRKEKEEVDKACTTLLQATSNLETPTKLMKVVTTTIVKSLLSSSDDNIIELPTGGPVSIHVGP